MTITNSECVFADLGIGYAMRMPLIFICGLPRSTIFFHVFSEMCGLGSSVAIVTDYGLDGPGSNPGWDEIFRPSGPALGPTQPPVKWVPVLSRG